MRSALRQNDASTFADEAEKSLKGSLLLDSALAMASQGMTTLGEVVRVAGGGLDG